MGDQTPIIIKKVKVHGHAHHGGAWKVAYADFVTAMMAFFMVMWIMGLSDDTRLQIAGYFNDPLGFTKQSPRSRVTIMPDNQPVSKADKVGDTSGMNSGRIQMEELEQLEKRVEERLSAESVSGGESGELAGGVSVTITPEGLNIEFVENDESGIVFFESGSARIRPAAAKLIAQVAPILQSSGRAMFVDGHTDSQRFGTSGYDNYDLSQDRANSVRRELVINGVHDQQIAGVRGFADRRLKKPDNPYHFSNRRVTVLLPLEIASGEDAILPTDALTNSVEGAFRPPSPSPVTIRDQGQKQAEERNLSGNRE